MKRNNKNYYFIINHSLPHELFLYVEIWEYHFEDGIGKGFYYRYLLFLNLSKIYLLTLIPDSIAPFIYPWEIKAVSVPAQ